MMIPDFRQLLICRLKCYEQFAFARMEWSPENCSQSSTTCLLAIQLSETETIAVTFVFDADRIANEDTFSLRIVVPGINDVPKLVLNRGREQEAVSIAAKFLDRVLAKRLLIMDADDL